VRCQGQEGRACTDKRSWYKFLRERIVRPSGKNCRGPPQRTVRSSRFTLILYLLLAFLFRLQEWLKLNRTLLLAF